MNDEELRSTIAEIKAQVKAKPENKDKSDDDIDKMILDGFYDAFTKGELPKEDLMAIAEAMGYEPDEEFAEAPKADEKTLEDMREIKPGESKEEFKEKVEEVKEDNPAPAPKADEADDKGEDEDDLNSEVPDDDEDAQRKRASKLFGMDMSKKPDND